MSLHHRTFRHHGSLAAAIVMAAGLTCGIAGAQTPDPAPAVPPAAAIPHPVDERGRRLMNDEPTVLAFKNVPVDQVMMFIVETTGKVVLPQPDVLTRRITVLNDQPISRARALDLVFFALQQNGIAVVEMPDLILLRDIAEIDRQDVPVLGPDVRVRNRTDLGTIVEKVFSLHRGSAENVGEILKTSVPNFAKLSVDAESNQLIVMGNIGLLQRMETLIEALDQAGSDSLSTETFHLRYADAEQVATNIKELYSAQQRTGAQGGGQQNPFQQFFQNRGGGGPGGGGQGGGQGNRQGGGAGGPGRQGGQGGAGTDQSLSSNIRVTASKQQNSVTVLAERQVLDQVRSQILDAWDKPLPEEDVVPRVYELTNSDPIKIRDVLRELFGQPQGQTGGGGGTSTQGVGRLAGQFSFEAVPESSKLLVMTKSQDNFNVIDDTIAQLDQPQTAGLPRIVELKHASAEELAEQLNALLSQEGTLAQIPRQESGLSDDTTAASPFASDQTTTTNQGTTQQTQAAAGTITFWWQRARPPTTTAGASNLVSKIRIVPVWRQNALMILSPPEYQQSVTDLIQMLDKPGRQVLLSAVIAEISIDDETALGVRWSSSAISPTNPDNAFAIGTNQAGTDAGGLFTGTKNNLLPGLFDTSVLNVGVDLNVLLQALAQKTKINILSEPRIFTSDNQEADFFAGQDIPFVTDSQTTDNGTLNQSFDYRAVGINLRVRPRITVKRDVDLRINLELSSIQPNQTLFGGFIVDRRETTTHLIVQDGQTVVVSGILRTEDSDVKRKVPLLGDIPLIGGLFTSTEKTKSRTELVAFITPIVIENPEEADKISEADRAHLRELHNELSPPWAGPEQVAPATPDK